MLHQLLEFSARHLPLILAFIVILILLLTFELHSKLTGVSGVSPQQTTLLINHNGAIVVDIRDAASFAKGHILNSVNAPLAELESKLKQLQKYKDKPVILNYHMGQHHHKVAKILKKNGFTDLYHLKGGVAAWQQANLPLVKK